MYARIVSLLCCVSSISIITLAQDGLLRGTVLDEKKSPFGGVHIRLVSDADSSKFFLTSTNPDGSFQLSAIPPGRYRAEVTAVGYRKVTFPVRMTGDSVQLPTLSMVLNLIRLREVVVEGEAVPATQIGDTTEYQAAAIKVNRDATAEDLLTKMPGITVVNGTVSAGGETVQRVLVDGKPFFGDDPTLAIRNLPAEVIDKIQVFDQMSDQAQFTGFDDGQSVKALNIVTRRPRGNLHFGKFAGGYGENQRYEAGGNLNLFDGDRRISVLGLSDNVNEQNFSTQDILGVLSGNAQGRPAGRGPRPGSNGGGQRRQTGFARFGGGNSASSPIGQPQGINTTHMLGTNASDSVASDLFLQGSYFVNRTDNQNQQSDNREYLLGGDSTSLYDQTSDIKSRNFNHRLTGRIDFVVDHANGLSFLPQLFVQSNNANNFLDALITQNSGWSHAQTSAGAFNTGYSFATHILYRHKFDLPGQTISIDVGVGANRKRSAALLDAKDQYSGGSGSNDTLAQQSSSLTDGRTLSANLVYTEPVGVNSLVQVTYTPSISRSSSAKNTFDFDPSTDSYSLINIPLSSTYSNEYWTQSGGIGYRWRGSETNLTANLSFQLARLNGTNPSLPGVDVSRKFATVMPSALFLYTMPDHRSLRLYYRTFTRAPSITQLQQVLDNSNPLLLSIGNPDLDQAYSHSLLARYALTAPDRARSMFLLLAATYTAHYIGNATVIPSHDTTLSGRAVVPRGVQLTYPVNVDGYWNIRSFVTYGVPFTLIGSALNFNGGISYVRTPGKVNDVLSVARSVVLSEGFVIGSNFSEDFDFTISYAGNYTLAQNSQQPDGSGNYYNHTASIKWTWQFWDGIVLRNELSNALTNGLAAGFNQNSVIWNLSVAKKFLADQSGEVKIGVADLLGQNRSVNRTLTETSIDDVRNEVLTRYVLLSFTYTLR